MLFLHALGGIFGLLLVVAVGYVLAWKGWFSTECQMLLPRLVTYVALPPFLMSTFLQSFDRDNLLHMLYGALLPFTSQILTFSLAWVVGRAVRVRRRRLGLFCACVSNSNTIFVGIPVNLELVLLPDELFRKKGSAIGLRFGEPVSHSSLQGGRHAASEAAELKKMCYDLRG